MAKFDGVRQSIYDAFNKAGNNSISSNRSDARQDIIERMYVRVLTELCANRFQWTGLPDSVSTRFLELELVYRGLVLIHYDPEYDRLFALRGSALGRPNMQDDPTRFTVVGAGYPSRMLGADECVPIWANYLRMPDYDIISIYASRLAMIDRSIEINSMNSRRSKIIAVNNNSRLSAANINARIDAGDPAIMVDEGFSFEDVFSTIDLGADPDAIEKLHMVRVRMWSECIGLLGLDNINSDKRERMITAEAEANAEELDTMKAVNLHSRRLAARMISKRYDIDVSVRYTAGRQNAAIPTLEMIG